MIESTDIKLYLSGGADNTDPNASLGGVISSTEVTDDSLHNLFDVVSGSEARTGDTEYRMIYLKNEHPTLTYYGAKIWIYTDSTSEDTDIEIGVEGSVGTAQIIANESTAPITTSFKDVTGDSGKWLSTAEEAGTSYYISIGNLAAGEAIGVWVKRVVSALALAYSEDTVVLKIQGDTEA